MNIYISGISGTGMGPLALMAKDAGHEVYGSDLAEGPIASELRAHGIDFKIGPQDGAYLKRLHATTPIDWFVYTSALPANHPELTLATNLGLKTSKRDEFISHLVSALGLKMVAIAGTHGKTTTTAMLIWAAKQLGLSASYLVGTTLPFAPAGKYTPGDIFFIYEADEYDRNFLHFHPWLSLIPTVTYDHPDIYKTPEDYQAAFRQFENQSQTVLHGGDIDPRLTLSGSLRREDATLALRALEIMSKATEPYDGARKNSDHPKPAINTDPSHQNQPQILIDTLNAFPGAGRRFELIAPGVYSDYAHHPEEIAATIKMSLEEAKAKGLKGVVALYQPHQNTRQHKVRTGYKTAFSGVDKLYWLPTYLTREDQTLPVLKPTDFISDLDLPNLSPLDGRPVAEPAELDDHLAERLTAARAQGYLVLLLTAGPADTWFRQLFQ